MRARRAGRRLGAAHPGIVAASQLRLPRGRFHSRLMTPVTAAKKTPVSTQPRHVKPTRR